MSRYWSLAQVDTHVLLLVRTGRDGGHAVHSSGVPEQVRQSGWQEEHVVEVLLDWKKPVGQLRADWQVPLTTSCPDGHDVQKSADPSQVAHVLEQAIPD